MNNKNDKNTKGLGELEQLVMDYVWSKGKVTAEDCREGLAARWPMKDSTVRTILRRLEEKGFLAHEVDGRTYVYRPVDAKQNVAARVVKQVIDRFCGGSVEQLLVGMVDSEILDQKQLERLAHKIAQRKGRGQ
ncbi:MAG TPA: BlaI/MecI/CopY family transcriptional regulator [Blastocatellia bacterium]|nr:BlaI/MecI/CopY family transcriptional regulator [Blastocatellia bacterium]